MSVYSYVVVEDRDIIREGDFLYVVDGGDGWEEIVLGTPLGDALIGMIHCQCDFGVIKRPIPWDEV